MEHLKLYTNAPPSGQRIAPATWNAWHNHNLKPSAKMETEHEGLATRVPFELTNRILWELLDDFVLVSDDEINEAIRLLARHAGQVAERAGAASLAAAIKLRDQLQRESRLHPQWRQYSFGALCSHAD